MCLWKKQEKQNYRRTTYS